MQIIFTPKSTRADNVAEAYRWLDRAVKLEADGKSESLVNVVFNRALAFEDRAFALPA